MHYFITNETIKKKLKQLQIQIEKKYLETKNMKGDFYMKDYTQDDAYIYANKSGDSELTGLVTVLIMIGLIVGYFLLK